MGAQQSSEGSASDAATATAAKTCYYELLGVERQATDNDIKKAYRRKALELHPDRNLDDVETATQRFAEVQSAYEILSDLQERAWYDSHRDTILSGQDINGPNNQPTTYRNVRLTSAEEIMTLIRKFNSTVPFDDEPTGFFGIARETFEHLALEEEAAADHDDIDIPEYPTFGSSDDGYESVVKQFYSIWAGFSTAKSFAWRDKYRLSDAPDRRIRRLMEKENKKIREDAIREFNDAVKFLVSFVRKRDPRYILNLQTDAERQSVLRNAAAAQAARSRAANQERLASFDVPEWAQSKLDESHAEDQFSQTEEESEVEILECVVCNKNFKSEKQLEAHERSKKHIKAVQQLRRQMKREGADLQLDEVKSTFSSVPTPSSTANPVSDVKSDKGNTAPDEQSQTQENILDQISSTESVEVSDSDDEYAPRDIVEERLASGGSKLDDDVASDSIEGSLSSATRNLAVDRPAPEKKIGKAKAKRQKKAAAAAVQSEQGNDHQCSVCGEVYTSKTKLFNHIRENGHAAPVLRPSAGGKKKNDANGSFLRPCR